MKTEVSMQYAQALFDLALDAEKEEFYNALKVINQAIVDDQEVLKVFKHPSITPDQKKKIINQVLANQISDTFITFLYVIIDHQRVPDLKDILDTYKTLLDDFYNHKEAIIYTKYPLNNNQKKTLQAFLAKQYGKEIILIEQLDESLMGGIKIVVDNEILDATSLNKLQKIKDILKG